MNTESAKSLADRIAAKRGRRYPAHEFIAEKFPDYMEALLNLDEVIREKDRLFDERMHELFHILALAVAGSNPHNQPHLRQHLKKGLQLGLKPEEIGEALMVCVNPCGAKVLTYGVTCMLEAMEELKAEGWEAPE
ncbi:MAG: carboxymuconolactone decarboxylase family protein [Nitrospinaceae bacterium]|jgi:alkylhydroperoxidase/carboxymuconolactone decarboxylase family protein YurZ|nr:carboxymuconolactone decarboxylase family protein [Nitrospinaceae bacterium]MBT3820174.1 carboxymuconolactone decarboxylase family protein [Nitrospinaceae bacterium]MBT4094931.1 carboxymuconolactone decarboxylase family protein [Nitrospinaceae bacterium]MBT4430951.1 carboxymuconolactone decarboxylase family protein [Nitrospinaceae bacterium]MBT5368322.1 carboxymuconolactone decarboxylase family protein [Nitrospinaceae bacterium]